MRLHVQGKEGINLWWGWGGRAEGSVVSEAGEEACKAHEPALWRSPPLATSLFLGDRTIAKLPFCCSLKLTKRKTELSRYHGLTNTCKIRNNASEYVAS
jgi:hypothetical protein